MPTTATQKKAHQIINLDEHRVSSPPLLSEPIEIESILTGLLDKHCAQEDSKPLSASFFDRVEQLKVKSKEQEEGAFLDRPKKVLPIIDLSDGLMGYLLNPCPSLYPERA